MPIPNLYQQESSYGSVPGPLNKADRAYLEVLYVTDRTRNSETENTEVVTYGNSRSASAAFGVAQIALEPALGWEALANASDGGNAGPDIKFGGVKALEFGRYPESPYVFSINEEGKSQVELETHNALNLAKQQFRQLILSRLETNETNDVVLFVHGFNNSFEYATQTLSGISHFLKQRQVPIVYSWPAGVGGIRGYFIDRISGQYTIFHLKEMLRTLFEIPEIEKIHIVAHSRGTDVITTAMRELLIEKRGSEDNIKQEFRVANLILAAPDLDYGVVRQRLMAERFGEGFDQITVYTTSTDKALTLSQFLMRGIRFGLLASNNIKKRDSSILKNIGNVNFVLATDIKSLTGHDYFFSDPAVSSDLITLINHSAKPGSDLRPLTHQGGNFWLLDDQYPNHGN